jgi:hypothetical protein
MARRGGLGRTLLGLIIDWGQRSGCTELRVEVDRDLDGANAFWSRQSLRLDESGPRNLYLGTLRPVELG